MPRPKGSRNKPKTEQVQYELAAVTKPLQREEEIMTSPTIIGVSEVPDMPLAEVEVKTVVEEQQTLTEMLETKAPPRKIIQEISKTEKKRIEDEKLVRGTFVYRAKPGGRYRTALRKYKRDPNAGNAQGFIKIDMIDGKSYTVPYWVAEWLNGEADLGCSDWKHNAANINLDTEVRPPPERVPVFRFVIQEYV